MISWWWLLAEACLLILVGARARGLTRKITIIETLADREKMRGELRQRARGGRWSDDDCRDILTAPKFLLW